MDEAIKEMFLKKIPAQHADKAYYYDPAERKYLFAVFSFFFLIIIIMNKLTHDLPKNVSSCSSTTSYS